MGAYHAVAAIRAHKGQQLAVAADGARQAPALDCARPVAEAPQDGVAAGIDALKRRGHEVEGAAHWLRCRAHQPLAEPLDKACRTEILERIFWDGSILMLQEFKRRGLPL